MSRGQQGDLENRVPRERSPQDSAHSPAEQGGVQAGGRVEAGAGGLELPS